MHRFVTATALAVVSLAACGGRADTVVGEGVDPCAAELPPVATAPRILRLDALDLGDLDATGARDARAWRTKGMNLDARCSARAEPATHSCRPTPNTSRADGENGIDNAFAEVVLPMLATLDSRPSLSASGVSYLAIEGGGRATLYLGTPSGRIRGVVPLVSARLSAPGADGRVTLGAVAPLAAFRASVADYAGALGGGDDPDLCGSDVVRYIDSELVRAADLRADGTIDPDVACDGLSLGITFVPSAVTALPELPPKCGAGNP